ncbi:DNA methyltransferase [Clostridium sp. WILCCON 0269]|uniref:Methyltransferase n=1 Tax=Candidatus Clostridium eludens TaxID=3381663 RepID=A0ABW8SKH7_9CLOT
MVQPLWYRPVWKLKNRRWGHSLHGMCSYLAMFPPSLPHYFIKQFTEVGDVVFDPFCGRGTTPLEACLNKRIGIGNDLNPLAQVLTGAKIDIPTYGRVVRRIDKLQENYKKTSIFNVDPNIRMLYDEEVTLPMLVYLKNTLNIQNSTDRFIMAMLLGIMHGKHRKDGTSIYLSIDMPNTFSMSPNYVRNFIREHKLQKLRQNVFQLLKSRVLTLYKNKSLPVKGKVYKRNARTVCNARGLIRDESVDLIVTSPPYLKLINYGKYNWIRLWMLDKESHEVDDELRIKNAYASSENIKLSDDLKKEEYLEFMSDTIISWERVLKNNSLAVIVIGDVFEYGGKYINLAEEVWKYTQEKGTILNCRAIIEDKIKGNSKVTKIWGKQRKGQATKIDRILVLSKGEAREPKYTKRKDFEKIFCYED